MIYVLRSSEPQELNLTDPESIGYKELEEAKKTTFTKDTKFPFKAYKNDNVKSALSKMFNGKCGYCEGRINGISFEEIEHFRPKKAIQIEGKKGLTYPGYYWLAMKWDNLLISCQRCNRVHKKNYFPLLDEDKRDTGPTEESLEEPLLLNPCKDNPSEHFVFTNLGYIMFRNGSIKGKKSIEFYGLYRKELTEERALIAKEIELKMMQIYDGLLQLKFFLHCKDMPGSKEMIEMAILNILTLYDLLLQHVNDPERPFREMAKQLTSGFLNKHEASLNNLKERYDQKVSGTLSQTEN